MSGFQDIRFAPGQQIFSVGDAAQSLFIIQEGVVGLVPGNGKPIAEISSGESFGEQAFLPGGIRAASAVARTAVTCWVIPADELALLMKGHSPMLPLLLEALLLQLSMKNHLQAG